MGWWRVVLSVEDARPPPNRSNGRAPLQPSRARSLCSVVIEASRMGLDGWMGLEQGAQPNHKDSLGGRGAKTPHYSSSSRACFAYDCLLRCLPFGLSGGE